MLSFETKGNLQLKGETDNTTWQNIQNHVVGTQESDLLQIYTEPVTIHGTIFLKNLQLLKQTSIIIGGEVWVNDQVQQKYWLKNTNQVSVRKIFV